MKVDKAVFQIYTIPRQRFDGTFTRSGVEGDCNKPGYSGQPILSDAVTHNPTSIGITNMVFSRAFCAVVGAQANFAGTIFTGVARGKRYEVSLCGAINTAGAGANYLPGDTAGTVNSGGVYV
ncbi:hypothetical protein GRI33_13195 [Brucella sp. BO3]|uniref:hypothetical protein n=1 Tax=unclassified Brucella TaxID=2632610 RepID=UPI00084F98D9|nr:MULTISPECIES: hypothetical protein [unclassified Brucella]OEI84650.1 hypothetical protein BA060_02550 [Brucella sp. B13-0095]QMV27902.1 hypothetical protein GRI33_13195 [Brucella sp. BO3]